MADKRTFIEIETAGPSYLGWRGELLAELALARVPGLIVHKRPDQPSTDLPYDFLVATEQGLCFFVDVRAFSSMRLNIRNVETVAELRWSIDANLIRRAIRSQNPVVLFLFDADSDHGRYIRLDSLPEPASKNVTVRFPKEQTINKENVEKLVEELRQNSLRLVSS